VPRWEPVQDPADRLQKHFHRERLRQIARDIRPAEARAGGCLGLAAHEDDGQVGPAGSKGREQLTAVLARKAKIEKQRCQVLSMTVAVGKGVGAGGSLKRRVARQLERRRDRLEGVEPIIYQ
jgi:hypothetical protein